ncbi:hypothetical protein UCRPC4_g00572 [Phaeomoniella chlamydospora]|uniref:Uncharacterized protein n=1 Tax=Phaeomoniella chlamydospora TaxID=158046 RepID=A0A0G2HJ78_PHACM|nr:hypothetical protein UCRPC4_g00572 [Phaeomoniella chlamydospora]
MQRAAASTPSSITSTPNTPGGGDHHASKRRRTGDYLPTTPSTPELQAISAAVAAEEQARNHALARHGNVTGETQWVLNIPGVPQNNPDNNESSATSASDISDSEFGSDAETTTSPPPLIGRQTFGSFTRKPSPSPTRTKPDLDSEASDSGSATGSSEGEDEETNYYSTDRTKTTNKKFNKKERQYQRGKDVHSMKGGRAGAISGNRQSGGGHRDVRSLSGGGISGANVNGKAKEYGKAFNSFGQGKRKR